MGRRFPLARWLSLLMGAWLFASAWIWGTADAARSNSMIVGICITAVALYAMFAPALRRLNTALAAWLLVSTVFVFEHASRAAMWNDVLVALVVGVASLASDVRRKSPQQERAFVARWARHRAR